MYSILEIVMVISIPLNRHNRSSCSVFINNITVLIYCNFCVSNARCRYDGLLFLQQSLIRWDSPIFSSGNGSLQVQKGHTPFWCCFFLLCPFFKFILIFKNPNTIAERYYSLNGLSLQVYFLHAGQPHFSVDCPQYNFTSFQSHEITMLG